LTDDLRVDPKASESDFTPTSLFQLVGIERNLKMTDAAVQLTGHDVAQVTGTWPFSLWSEKKQAREDEMLGLFLSMLDVRTRSMESSIGQDDFAQSVLQDVKAGISKLQTTRAATPGFSNAPAWNEAYRLERLLALIEPTETLSLDLDRRLNEAIANKLPSIERVRLDVTAAKSAAYDNSKQPPELNQGGDSKLRSAMINLLEEIHWDDQRKFYVTPILKTAVHRIVVLDLLAFVAVVVPYAWIFLRLFQHHIDLSIFWAALPLYTVITAGAFGAYFSRLIALLQNWDSLSARGLQTMKMWSSLFLRGAVGICGALVVFFFLRSGVIQGSVFPDFTRLGFDYIDYSAFLGQIKASPDQMPNPAVMHTIEPSASLALLAMWSFIAGFSERLVPTILSNTEASFSNAASGAGGNK
jgi:hypothetical protein